MIHPIIRIITGIPAIIIPAYPLAGAGVGAASGGADITAVGFTVADIPAAVPMVAAMAGAGIVDGLMRFRWCLNTTFFIGVHRCPSVVEKSGSSLFSVDYWRRLAGLIPKSRVPGHAGSTRGGARGRG